MEDRSSQITGVMVLFLTLAWIAVPLRCWVRIKITKSFAVDDWLTIISLFLFTIYAGFVFMGAYWGTGRHLVDLSPLAIRMAMKSWYFGEIFYIICCTFLRLAIGHSLLRLTIDKVHRIAIHTLNGLNVIFNLYFVLITILQCTPPQDFWELGRTRLHCINPLISVKSTFAQSGICAFTDWAFALLPIFLLWNLNMCFRKKVCVALLLSLGALASTASLIRIPYVITLSQTQDFLWATVNVVIWSSIEPGLGITAISLATLRPLLRKYFSISGLTKQSDPPGTTKIDFLTAQRARSVGSSSELTVDGVGTTELSVVKTFQVEVKAEP